jgi:hypothetical protein
VRPTALEIPADPFGEHRSVRRATLRLLGADVEFDSDHEALHELVRSAYARLPAHRLTQHVPRIRISLRLTARPRSRASATAVAGDPARLQLLSGAGLLGAAAPGAHFAIVSPDARSALVLITEKMLRFPYHVRYELLEFAVFTLAARAQAVVPLHAACVSRRGRGVLMLGPAGAGKSTAALHCALAGLDLVSEDSVFIAPETLRATGIANFLHVRPDSLALLKAHEAKRMARSPMIRRRSGVEKLEVDLREPPFRLAARAPSIDCVVFLSAERAARAPLLTRLRSRATVTRLSASQPFALAHGAWRMLAGKLARLPAYELRRGDHPKEGAQSLDALLRTPR